MVIRASSRSTPRLVLSGSFQKQLGEVSDRTRSPGSTHRPLLPGSPPGGGGSSSSSSNRVHGESAGAAMVGQTDRRTDGPSLGPRESRNLRGPSLLAPPRPASGTPAPEGRRWEGERRWREGGRGKKWEGREGKRPPLPAWPWESLLHRSAKILDRFPRGRKEEGLMHPSFSLCSRHTFAGRTLLRLTQVLEKGLCGNVILTLERQLCTAAARLQLCPPGSCDFLAGSLDPHTDSREEDHAE